MVESASKGKEGLHKDNPVTQLRSLLPEKLNPHPEDERNRSITCWLPKRRVTEVGKIGRMTRTTNTEQIGRSGGTILADVSDDQAGQNLAEEGQSDRKPDNEDEWDVEVLDIKDARRRTIGTDEISDNEYAEGRTNRTTPNLLNTHGKKNAYKLRNDFSKKRETPWNSTEQWSRRNSQRQKPLVCPVSMPASSCLRT